jgi:lipopolysaccharide/colanic/teichoic acid biosynthesis glycosyltransferase
VLQPLEKLREETVAPKRSRPVPVLVDTRRAATALVAPTTARPDAFIDVTHAVRSKTYFLTIKRVLDTVIAGLAILALSPVLLLTAAAIGLTSKGPVLFRQTRYGLGNVPFTLYKFRSMYVDRQDVSGIAHTVEHDPRVTRVGRFIRRWYIDELPQLFNVLKGDMSIVGPRAQVMGMRAVGVVYEDLVPFYRARHAVRPGITGLAQVRGFRGEIKNAEQAFARIDCDLEYIQRATLWLDIKILALTMPSVIFGSVDC